MRRVPLFLSRGLRVPAPQRESFFVQTPRAFPDHAGIIVVFLRGYGRINPTGQRRVPSLANLLGQLDRSGTFVSDRASVAVDV